MSISYKKVNKLIEKVLLIDSLDKEYKDLDSAQIEALSRLCKEIYMLESSPGNEYSSSQVQSDMKGKISLSADRIVGEKK